MDTKELMKQVGQIRITTSHLVDDFLGGEYHSVFKGQGMEFDEVREYTPGDDVRTIDWNVTARTGTPYIKRFSEERELTLVFLVDVSGSLTFGSGSRTKAEVAAEITCLLALSAISNQDKVGLILFSDRILKYIPPRKGRKAVMRMVREVLATEKTNHETDIASAIQFLNSVQKRKAIVFMVSDFQDSNYERQLRTLARHHDVVTCHISDPREWELPNVGLLELQDPETGELRLVDTSQRLTRKMFSKHSTQAREELELFFKRNKIDSLFLSTDKPVIDDLRQLFQLRKRRVKRH